MRRTLKWILPALIVSAVLGGLVMNRPASIPRQRSRFEEYSTAVNRYGEYAAAYESYADKKESIGFETCYGGRWDRYTRQISKDAASRRDDLSYLRSKAAYFRKLKEKYDAAVAHPEAKITLDPPLDQ